MLRGFHYHWGMSEWQKQLVQDYERLLARVAAYAKKLEVEAPFSVYAAIEEIRNRFQEAEDWTEEELEELMVDLEGADAQLRKAGRSLVDWLRMDAALIEEKMLTTLTDDTKLAWLKLRQQAQIDSQQD